MQVAHQDRRRTGADDQNIGKRFLGAGGIDRGLQLLFRHRLLFCGRLLFCRGRRLLFFHDRCLPSQNVIFTSSRLPASAAKNSFG